MTEREENLAQLEEAEGIVSATDKRAGGSRVPRRRSVGWWVVVGAGLVAASALIIAIVAALTISSLNSQLEEAKTQASANRVETTCRAKATADLDIARANLDVVQGDLDIASATFDAGFNDLIRIAVFTPTDQRDPTELAAVQTRIADASATEDKLQPQLVALAQAVQDAASARAQSVSGCLATSLPTNVPTTAGS